MSLFSMFKKKKKQKRRDYIGTDMRQKIKDYAKINNINQYEVINKALTQFFINIGSN